MLPYVTKGTLWMWLSFLTWRVILCYPCEPNVITKVLIRRRQENQIQRETGRWRTWPWAKKCRQPPEAGRGKETDPPIQPPEEVQHRFPSLIVQNSQETFRKSKWYKVKKQLPWDTSCYRMQKIDQDKTQMLTDTVQSYGSLMLRCWV